MTVRFVLGRDREKNQESINDYMSHIYQTVLDIVEQSYAEFENENKVFNFDIEFKLIKDDLE